MLTTTTITTTAAGPEPGDGSLVERLRSGDHAAFEATVRRYGAQMLAVARRVLRNEEDAREVVQEAFLQAFRALEDFRADAKLSTWLHRIVVNTALMRLRAASRRPEGFLDDLLPNFDTNGHHVEPVTALPIAADEAVERAEVRARVRAAVARLPEAYRAIIVLRDFEDLTTEEAASTLGISPNAAKIRLHRARQSLATLLRDPVESPVSSAA
jgi:RNA polymerase sigma-70 factor (ECF subfamily)